ncbi:sulfite exporter TauE/SafE family protein [Chloropicon primus]|nr:sulfite exporter TauE/SafE family protein [Chloropicon primus]
MARSRAGSWGVLRSNWVLLAACLLLASLASAAVRDDGRDRSESPLAGGGGRPPAFDEVQQQGGEAESIWTPLPTDPKGIAGLCLAVVFIAVAAGSGLGGGGVLVPLYITFFGINSMHAVALSNVTILGSSIMNVIINSRRAHPLVHSRRMIDWEVVLLLEPASILGTVLGGMMNKTFPVWLSMLLMMVFLALMTARTYKKAIKLYLLESRAMEANDVTPAESSFRGSRTHQDPVSWPPSRPGAHGAKTEPESPDVGTGSELVMGRKLSFLDLATNEKHFEPEEHPAYVALGDTLPLVESSLSQAEPLRPGPGVIAPMIALQASVGVLFLVKQASVCGSVLFWSITSCFLPLTVAFQLYSRWYLTGLHRKRLEARTRGGYAFVQGDCMWDASKFLFYPSVAVLAGVIAAWFGLGGGIVKGPLLMELGLLPEVVVATSSAMMLFTTLSTVCGYIAMRRLLVYYAVLLFSLALVTTLLAQLVLKRVINRLRRPSLVIFLFATVCLLGVLGVLLTSLEHVEHIFHGDVDGFRGICSKEN